MSAVEVGAQVVSEKQRTESVMFLILTQLLIIGGGIATTLFVVTIVGSEIKADPIVG